MEKLLPKDWGFFKISLGISIDVALRYLLLAGVAWLLGYVFFKRHWIRRKIIQKFPTSAEMRREAAYSLMSMLVFGLVGAATVMAAKAGHTRIYWKPDQHGWPWFWCGLVLAIIVHDAYFYWTHRFMHHPKLFKLFHRVHHISKNPSPWAAYAFSPLEAVVQAGIFPLVAVLFPINIFAFSLFMLWQITFNIFGHTGYEIHHKGLMDSPLRFFLNTPTNHIQHHEKMRGNYGLYFSFWDYLMGTQHKDYEKRYREVTSRPPAPSPARAPEAAGSPELESEPT